MAKEQEERLIPVLADEYKALHGAPPADNDLGSLPKIYAAIHGLRDGRPAEPRTALCLSGGGIRSASFALGVLQAFAAKGLLERFHYLSTVSGGGYIGGWLTAWRHVHDTNVKDGRPSTDPMTGLNERTGSLGREPEEVRGLRVYSNYLTPKLGVLSADTWALAALYLRNLLLNWVIYLPLIVAVILTPILAQTVLKAAVDWNAHYHRAFLAVACLLLLWSLYTSVSGREAEKKKQRVTQGWFLLSVLLPIYCAAMLICLYSVGSYRARGDALLGGVTLANAIFVMATLHVVAWGAFALRSRGTGLPRKGRDVALSAISWAVAGGVSGALIAWGIAIATDLVTPHGMGPDKGSRVLVIFGVGWVASSMFIGEAVYLGLTSRLPKGDENREWLARSSGWFLALTIVWGLMAALVLFAPEIRRALEGGFWALIPAGGAAGAIAAGIGSSAKTLASMLDKKGGGESVSMSTILAAASVIFLIALTIVLAKGIDIALPWWIATIAKSPLALPGLGPAWPIVLAIVLCLLVVVLASVPINVNRFSSHSLYRNRLARAFLGSARGSDGQKSETRDPLTGFDTKDNPAMAQLAIPAERPRLFHVVNMALNVVSGKNTAWQERMAEPFVVTPQVAGNEYVGFRPSAEYGQRITLGTCMAISGAAASPNQGYHSSPLIGLIMTLFNVRLGWWLGNPNNPKTADLAGPRWGVFQVIKEMFGLTDDANKYVYLSDGGHFENLGLYEMVRRRCHMIVVSDGGADPNCAFEDLGNAVRKIWIDLGVRIEFERIQIHKRGAGKDALYCALGRIHYPEQKDVVKANPDKAGYVLYIKPSFHDNGTEPPDVCAYALANLTFPHETTGDQFFSESQLESYRSLGKFITDSILGKEAEADVRAPTEALRPYWKHLSTYIDQFNKQASSREPVQKAPA
jgi:hypothetical protein